jgi:hypothetical protein
MKDLDFNRIGENIKQCRVYRFFRSGSGDFKGVGWEVG